MSRYITKVAVVTGGASGIGDAIVRGLLAEGASVAAFLPGYTYTPGMRMAVELPEHDKAIVARIPLRRAASPAEIAAPALFLVSDDARYIAGASLVVDGGWELTGCPDPRHPAIQK